MSRKKPPKAVLHFKTHESVKLNGTDEKVWCFQLWDEKNDMIDYHSEYIYETEEQAIAAATDSIAVHEHVELYSYQ